MKTETRNELIGNFAWAGAIVVLALAGSLARKAGYIDAETVTRLVIGAIGLMVAWQGNRMPKNFVPNACARQVRRFAGWSMTLSGLIYAGLFLFAPLRVAYLVGPPAIVTGIGLTLAYCLTLRSKGKTA